MSRALPGPLAAALLAAATAAAPRAARADDAPRSDDPPRAALATDPPRAARADEPRDRTLVLVAPPPVLVDAVRTSLAPWQIRVVVIDQAASTPEEIATVNRAGFVAIGGGGELHLYDHDAPVAQRRPMAADLGEADAAALALTIKTWMRLGPPPAPALAPPPEPAVAGAATTDPPATSGAAPADPVAGMAPTGGPGGPPPLGGSIDRGTARTRAAGRPWRIGATAALGVRVDQGGLGEIGPRAILAAGLATRPIDVAVGVELGSGGEVWDVDQPARWSEWLLFVHASRRFPLGPSLALRPIAGVALVRASVDGVRMANAQPFDVASSNLGVDGAVELGWRAGPLAAGVTVGVTAVPFEQHLQHRNVRFVLPARVEPWGSLGVGASF